MQSAAAGHLNPLDQPERLGRPLTFSLIFHGLLAAVLLFGAVFKREPIPMGDKSPGMGVAINAVKRIPIPQKSGQINPLANDTESVVPQEKPLKLSQQKPAPPPPPEKAIELPTEKPLKPVPKRETAPVQFRPNQVYAKNQVFSKTPEALKSPQIGIQGGGGVGIGPNSPFGFQFGAYAQQVRDLISQKWNQNGVTSPLNARAVITFEIARDGSISNVRVAGPSGSYTLDNSSKRAVLDASPLPPLPIGFSRSSADVELWFQLTR